MARRRTLRDLLVELLLLARQRLRLTRHRHRRGGSDGRILVKQGFLYGHFFSFLLIAAAIA